MIEQIKQLDLSTREGRDAAWRLIGSQRMADAISQWNAALEAETDTEALENQLEELETLFEFQSERPRPTITPWDEITGEPREWLIPNWMPANTVTMFTGEGGAGKSWLTLQAVCQIACGYQDAYLDPDYKPQKIADYDDNPPEPKHIVFATYEDEPAEIKRRIQALASNMTWIENSMDTIKQHLHIVDMRGIGSVWGPGIGKHIANTGDLLAAGEDLREICEEKEARLLVMDPLSGAFGGNENDRTAVYDFVSSFRGWGDTTRCAMLVIGHLPKSQEGKAAGFSGSTAWEASARSMWMLSKKTGTDKRSYWTLEHTKSNYAPLQPDIPLVKEEYGSWWEADNKEEAAEGFDEYSKQFNIQEGENA